MEKSFSGQWYRLDTRPSVMNKVAGIVIDAIANKSKSGSVEDKLLARYTERPYESRDWFHLDGEFAMLASRILKR